MVYPHSSIRDEYYLPLEYGEPPLWYEPESLGEPLQSRACQATDAGTGQSDRHWGTDSPVRILFPEHILLRLPSRGWDDSHSLHGQGGCGRLREN